MAKILIVDDEKSIRRSLRDVLEIEKYKVEEAVDGLDALVKVKQDKFDIIILDIKMPKLDGLEALERIQLLVPETPVIMISGHADIDVAVVAVKKGAFDFISKPLDLNRLLITLRNAMDKSNLIIDKKVLQKRISRSKKVTEIVGESQPIQDIKETIEKVAPTDARVLINGQNGTGKELVARWIHAKSPRKEEPIIEVNCAAIPSELIESELFGHQKGSFTSAHKDRKGKFELANGGTLFLDEIGDMSLSAQAKVLRALQENTITRVGGDKSINVDVRVIAATNKDLREEISKGRFREDLYHRLAVIIMTVPSLNERKDDIPLLVDHFVNDICGEYKVAPKKIEPAALKLMQKLNWSGNIRELRNVVERLIIMSQDSITKKDVENYVVPSSANKTNLESLFSQFKNLKELQRYILKEYEKFNAVLV
jgi:DNA-binding NtrC family response regulator